MSSTLLTEQQISFFETFGYVGFPGLLADRVGAIIEEFEALWARNGGGHFGQPHDEKRRSCIAQFIDHSEYLSSLLDDPRIKGIAESLLGDDYNYMGSDGNYYVGDTGWHSDGWHKDLRHIKIAFYLDDLTRDTGCLRVIPGSHRIEDAYAISLQQQAGKSRDLWGIGGADVPAVALETKPGDILCFNHNTKHAAFGGGVRRRMFTMNLCQRYPESRLDDLRNYMSGGARFWVERGYGDAMIRTATPTRMRHLEQVMANDGHLAELSRLA
ncbi:MAG: phytanoyl-CoA dioxygenase family protein, partial [Candidatus Poribacteria bacterium]|nr:phytanoyl-CoA dioxygenase family protein [Candidatus Poribacteria bacterium]